MPPRFVYWTILIDGKPTAFRATDKDDLLATVTQLRRTNKDVALKYFARGKVWDSPEQAHDRSRPSAPAEKRGRDWRPGGSHEDPRARFDRKKKRRDEQDAEPTPREDKPGPSGPSGARRPWQEKPAAPSGARRPWQGKPPAPSGERRPWQDKPSTSGGARRPWDDKPRSPGGPKSGGRPWTPKPEGTRPPWQNKPAPGGARRPWQDKPAAPSSAQRPWQGKPSTPSGARRPWQDKPAAPSGARRPWDKKPYKKPKPPNEE